jgi:hypothetical protein
MAIANGRSSPLFSKILGATSRLSTLQIVQSQAPYLSDSALVVPELTGVIELASHTYFRRCGVEGLRLGFATLGSAQRSRGRNLE